MTEQLSLSVVVPAYNEEERLEATLREMAAYLEDTGRSAEIIVADDGSADGPSLLVQALAREIPGLRLIRLPANRGKGYAVRTGVVNSVGERVLFADADGATPFAELARLDAALDAGADVAIGSRALEQDSVEVKTRFYRRIMGRAFHALVSTVAIRGYQDTQCGFKLLTSRAAHDLFSRMRMNGFSFDVEMLLMAQQLGFRIAEVPVNWTHQPGSRVNLVVDSMKMAKDLFVIRSHLLRGDYRDAQVATPLAGQQLRPAVTASSFPE